MSLSEVQTNARRQALGAALLVVCVYLLATWMTNAFFMADTADYVESIAARDQGSYYNFWEFGHLLWRPLGWVSYHAARPLVGSYTPVVGITLTLMALNWVAGLASAVLLYAAVRAACHSVWAATVAAVAFIFAQGFLDNAQTGSAYVFGLAFLLLGLYVLIKGGEAAAADCPSRWHESTLAGLALALSVCFWFPYLWALPGALLAPFFLFGAGGRNRRLVLRATLVCAVAGAALYLCALALLGIHDANGLKLWITSSSHGNTTKGATRMLFGLARSFINMGNDGMLFKRYLLHDPFNPVSLWTLLRLSVGKLVLFYLFLAALALHLLRAGRERRILCLLLAGSLPIIAFAVFFDGGAIERYLPLYPFVFIALAAALCSRPVVRPAKWLLYLFIAVMICVNAVAMAKPTLERQENLIAARIVELQPRLKPHSRVYTVTWVDELINFNRSFPFHPLNQQGGLHLYSLVTPGSSQVLHWRQDFAAQSLDAWRQGGDVWLAQQAFAQQPRADWNWAEGDDPNVSWRDFPSFFAPLETAETVGGADGFVRLPPSPANESYLAGWATKQP